MTAKEILEEHLETMSVKLDNNIKTVVLFAMDEHAKEYHTEQLRLLSVVRQSEQLKAFAKHYNSEHYERIEEKFVDDYLKSL